MKFFILCVLFITIGCEKKDTPEAVLKEYIQQFLLNDLSKTEALEYLGGEYRERVEQMNGQKYIDYLAQNHFKQRSFKVLIKNCSSEKCDITYLIKYKQQTSKGGTYYIDVKKIARLEKVEQNWKIMDIDSVKTYIEAKDTINL